MPSHLNQFGVFLSGQSLGSTFSQPHVNPADFEHLQISITNSEQVFLF